jgi:hypothetical protein
MINEMHENATSDLDEALLLLSKRDHKFSKQVLRTVQAHRDAAIPRLIQAIEEATQIASKGETVESNLSFYCFSLLTEFRAKESLPAILQAISLPGEAAFELFGDLIHELLRVTLAEFCADSIETVDGLVSNRSLNEFVRWSAAGTYLHLVRNGRLTREEAVDRLRKSLQAAIQNEDEPGVIACVMELYNLAPVEAMDEIRIACQRNLMDQSIASLEDIENCCKLGTVHFHDRLEKCLSIEDLDTVEFLQHWNWQDDFPPADFVKSGLAESTPTNPVLAAKLQDISSETYGADQSKISIAKTIRSETAQVGRNDPCPCGSGRKFKKCCGAHQ